MVSEAWQDMSLGEFVTLQRGHDLPEGQRVPGDIPVLGSFGITGWHNVAKANGPGITVGRSGASFGVVTYSEVDFWPLNTALYVIDFHGNDPRFAYYFLRQFDFKRYNSGSAQPSLNRNFVHPVQVRIPPISEQRAIAQVLSVLDGKIELNQQMNETLENTARSIFKSWFVDFDPVHARAEGTDTSLGRNIVELFPASFETSVIGEIPKGWQIRAIGDLATVNGGSTPSTKEPNYWDEGIHFWATPKDLSSLKTPVLLGTERKITDEGLAQIASGLLPEGAVLLSSRAPIGYLAIAEVPVAINQGFIAMQPVRSGNEVVGVKWTPNISQLTYINIPRISQIAGLEGIKLTMGRLPAFTFLNDLGIELNAVMLATSRLINELQIDAIPLDRIKEGHERLVGATLSFSALFRTKNGAKLWKARDKHQVLTFSGDLVREPHIYRKLGSLKLVMMIDPRWITSSTAFGQFSSGQQRFAGLSIVNRVEKGLMFASPLILGTPKGPWDEMFGSE
jgi:type I restriction enzyme, S subunit